jgi:excisionase family DNA binding protein
MTKQLAYTIAEACAAARIGKTAIYAFIKSGALKAVKCRRRTLILADELERFISSLPSLHPSDTSSTEPPTARKYVRGRSRSRTLRDVASSNPTHTAAPHREGDA